MANLTGKARLRALMENNDKKSVDTSDKQKNNKNLTGKARLRSLMGMEESESSTYQTDYDRLKNAYGPPIAEEEEGQSNLSLGKQILQSMNKNTQAAKASDRIKTIGTRPDLFQPNAYRLDVSEISDLSRLEKELENQQKLKEQFGQKLESYAWAVPHQETANTIPYERDRDNRDYQTIVSNIDQLNRKIDILKRRQNKAGLEQTIRQIPDYADMIERGTAFGRTDMIGALSGDDEFASMLRYLNGNNGNSKENNARYAGLTQDEKDTIFYLMGSGDMKSARKYFEDSLIPELDIRDEERIRNEAERNNQKIGEQRTFIENVQTLPDYPTITERAKNELLSVPYGKYATGNSTVPEHRRAAYSMLSRNRLELGTQYERLQNWTDDEKGTLLYLIGSGDEKSAQRYYDLVSRRANEEYQTAKNEEYRQMAKDNKALGVLANIYHSYAGLSALGETLTQNLKNKVEGTDYPVDIYSQGMEGANISEATEQGITEDMGEFGQFLTKTGLSMSRMATMLPFGKASLWITSADAAGRTAKEVAERGGSDDQALWLGLLSGAIEFGTEKLPLENLFRLAKSGKGVTKHAVREILKQAGIEGTEELVSEYANTLLDMAAMGENSSYNLRVKEYIKSGLSMQEAKDAANAEFFVVNPIVAGLGGTVSGLGFGSGGVVFNRAVNYERKPIADVMTELDQNPVKALQNPQNAEAILQPENVETVYEYTKEKYGEKGFEAAESIIEAANNTVKENAAVQKEARNTVINENVGREEHTNMESPQAEDSSYKTRKTKHGLTEEFRKQGAEYGMRTEDLDALDRIAKRTGTKYRFDTTAAENGSYYNGTITINPNSPDPIRRILGHEFAHFTETSDQYEGLKRDVLESPYITELLGEDINTVRQKIQRTYQADFDTKLKNNPALTLEALTDQEVFAQAMGNLMNAPDALRYVAKKRPAFIQKAIDFLQRIGDALTGKSDYEKFVREVENRFRDALYKSTKGNINSESDMKYSIRYDENGKADMVVVDDNIFQGHENEKPLTVVKNFLKEKIGTFSTIMESGQKVYFGKDLPGEYIHSKSAVNSRASIKRAKNQMPSALDEMIEIATNRSWKQNQKEKHAVDAKYGWYKYQTKIAIPVKNAYQVYSADLIIRNDADGKKYLYDILNIKKEPAASLPANQSSDINQSGSNNTIAQKGGDVNTSISKNGENDSQKSMTLEEEMESLREKYGVIPPGENPTREVKVPKKTTDKSTVSVAVRTIMEAGITPEEMLSDIQRAIVDGEFGHEVYTDKTAWKEAENVLEHEGFAEALKKWQADVRANKRMTKGERALGYLLYQKSVDSGDTEAAFDLLTDFTTISTATAQEMQAHRLLKKLTPAGQLMILDKAAKKIQIDLDKKRKTKAPKIDINKKLAKDLLGAKSQKDIDAAVGAIKQNIADQVPATWVDKINAWRYISMLGNVRTHVRNIVGNALFFAEREMKNMVGIGTERFVPKDQRTKSFLGLKALSPKSKALFEYAKESYNQNKGVISGNGKYQDNGEIQDMQRIYKNKILEGVRKASSKLLELEDAFFSRAGYIRSYAQAMKARGLTPETITQAQADALFEYAMKEAKKGTFQDASKLASQLNKIKNTNSATSIIGGGMIPFTKTPVNIVKRGVEYSPFGIMKAVYDGLTQIKKGNMTAAQVADEWAAGLTGTAIMALGAFLSHIGVLSGGPDEEKKKANFDSMTGSQNYAINIGNYSYTLDWAAPAALPLFLGVELQKVFADKDPGINFGQITEALGRITEPVFEMTMLQGVNNAIQTATYADQAPISAIATNAAVNYAGQFVPTILGQIARTIDPVRRDTYFVDKNSQLPADVQRFLKKNMAKIPGVSMMLPAKIDPWGRETVSEGWGWRALQNFLSPGYASVIQKGEVDKELERLYEQTGDAELLPAYAVKYFTVEGEKKELTTEEYVKFAKNCGGTALKELDALIGTQFYKNLSDEQKAKAIGKVYDYAKQTAKASVSDYEIERQWRRQKESGVPLSHYVIYKTFEGDQDEKISQIQKTFHFSESKAEEMYYKIESYLYPGDDLDEAKEKKVKLCEKYGFTKKEYMKAYNALRGVTGTKNRAGKTISGSEKRNQMKALHEAGFAGAKATKMYQILKGEIKE